MQNLENIRQPHEWLVHWAEATPDAPLFRDGVQELSYQQTLELSQKLTTKLKNLGVKPHQLVSLELPAGLQVLFMCSLFNLQATSQIHAETNQTADFLFTTSRAESKSAKQIIKVDQSFLREVNDTEPQTDHQNLNEADIVRLVYSSGTTGTPKAIPLTLDMVHHRSIAAVELTNQNEPFLSMLDLATASGFHTFYGSLMIGACYYNPGDGNHNLNLINRFKITAVKASPAQLAELTKQNQKIETLTHIYSAGSTMSPSLLRTLKSLTNARIFTLYGSSEAGRCAQRELTDDNSSNVGKIVEGTELRILNEKNDPTKPGKIQYRRAHQATNYQNDETTTSQTFDNGWFTTGDIGYLNENQELIIQGRVGDVINLNGVKLNLAELEQFALAQNQIEDAAAFVTHDQELALALVTNQNPNDLIPSLKAHFGPRSPSVIFKLPQLPRNNAGKLNREELKDLYGKLTASK